MGVAELQVTAGAEDRLLADFAHRFYPAIAAHPAFRLVRPLRPREGARWLMLIDFKTGEQRLAWVASRTHKEVWPALARSSDSAVGAHFDEVTL